VNININAIDYLKKYQMKLFFINKIIKLFLIIIFICMKLLIAKIFIITFLFFIITQVNAQIILTSEYNPVVGDAHILRNADEGEIEPGPSGENQLWNFSYLKAGFDSLSTFFIFKCSTPYGSFFDKANLASHDGKENYKYYLTTDSFYHYLGSGDTTKVIKFTDPFIILNYPFTYGNSFLDSFNSVFESGQLLIKRIGIRFVVADGFGNIVLPYGTINNVLRLKSSEYVIDSIFSDGTLLSVEQKNDTSYYWYKSDFKFPILVINLTYTETNSYKYVGFVQNLPTVGVHSTNSEIPSSLILHQNFPNPFNPTTYIKFDLPDATYVKLTVYDILGKEVKILFNEFREAGNYTIEFNGSELPSGIYYYRLITEKFSDTKKMLLMK